MRQTDDDHHFIIAFFLQEMRQQYLQLQNLHFNKVHLKATSNWCLLIIY